MKKSVSTLLFLFAALSAHAQNWPAFRGGSATGVADAAKLPTQWNAEKGTNILWKQEIPGYGHASPVVWGDRIFVLTAVPKGPDSGVDVNAQALTTEDKSEYDWRVVALDKSTGKILWQQTAITGKPRSKRHPQSSQASSTPVTNGKVVVAYFGSEGLYAYDFSGKLLWKKDLGVINTSLHFDPDLVYGTATSPVIYKNSVIVQVDRDRESFIAAYALKDGKELWRVARDEPSSWATPVIVSQLGSRRARSTATLFRSVAAIARAASSVISSPLFTATRTRALGDAHEPLRTLTEAERGRAGSAFDRLRDAPGPRGSGAHEPRPREQRRNRSCTTP